MADQRYPPSSESAPDRATLTEDGRRLLEERIRLVETTVGELRRALDDPECRVDSIEGYHRAAQELARLRAVLGEAAAVEDSADDPEVVELGDVVAVRLEDGTEETYVVVHAAEAPVEDRRISVDAPLGRALFGRRVGETVEVAVPGGSYRCTVLRASRSQA
jgi:transcription elongation GreA/GreB family factor